MSPIVFGQAIGNGSNGTINCGNGNCSNGGATAAPSLYPAVAWATSSPGLNSGGLTTPTTPTPGLSSANLGSTAALVGVVDGDVCTILAVVTTNGSTSQNITPNGDEEICITDLNVAAGGTTFTASSSNYQSIQPSFTRINFNGVIQSGLAGTSSLQYRLPRVLGTTIAVYLPANGFNFGFNVLTASTTANSGTPITNAKSFIGAFARPYGGNGAPEGMFQVGVTQTSPQPYPSPTTLLYGSTGYCDHVATNGVSISTGYPLDYYKMVDIVQLGVQWTRSEINPFYDDLSHLTPGGTYNFTDADSVECGLLRNAITPAVYINAGPVQYGTFASPVTNAVYKSPSDYAGYCTAVAQHQAAIFPQVTKFGIPTNEPNESSPPAIGDVSLTNNPTLYAGVQGLALYSAACYKAIKAVNPNYIVYWGELIVGQSSDLPGIFTSMYANGCRIGSCFDAFDLHFSVINNPLLTYDLANNGFQFNDGAVWPLLNNIQTAVAQAGETRLPLHIIFGESGFAPTVPSLYTMFGNAIDQAFMWGHMLLAGETTTTLGPGPIIDGISVANVDENCEYAGTQFANAGVMVTPNCAGNPSFGGFVAPAPSPNPAVAIIQPFAQVTPGVPPTLAPSTTSATPFPTPTPAIVQSKLNGPPPQLASAPSNGNVVVALTMNFANGANTMTDSNSFALTNETGANDGVNQLNTFDYIAFGSPTATYANAIGTSVTGMYEISNAIAPGRHYVENSTASAGATLVAPAFTAGVGDKVVCFVYSATGVSALASGNVTFTLDQTGGPSNFYQYSGTAVAAVSTTVTATITTPAAHADIMCGDYW